MCDDMVQKWVQPCFEGCIVGLMTHFYTLNLQTTARGLYSIVCMVEQDQIRDYLLP
jgi:hypothetical protein